jgi:hypothetical protein
MKLIQKRFPFGTVIFEIKGEILHVENRRLQSSTAFEVPIRCVESRITKMRQFPVGWLLLGILGCVAFVALSVGTIYAKGEAQLGAFAVSFCALVFTAFAWHGFFERKYDYVILYSRETGQPIIHIDRTSPSPRHVEEFVDILKEGLEASRES